MPLGQTRDDVDVRRGSCRPRSAGGRAGSRATGRASRRAGGRRRSSGSARPGRRRRSAAATRSDSRITSNISPSVPLSSVKPAARAASASSDEPSRRPTLTLMPVPSSESRRFCAWAGPCERPADDADLLDALERLGQQREQVAAAGDDGLLAVGHLDDAGFEHLGGEAHRAKSSGLERIAVGQRLVNGRAGRVKHTRGCRAMAPGLGQRHGPTPISRPPDLR